MRVWNDYYDCYLPKWMGIHLCILCVLEWATANELDDNDVNYTGQYPGLKTYNFGKMEGMTRHFLCYLYLFFVLIGSGSL